MKSSLLRSTAVLAALALGACAAEDTQTTQQDIDHDITVTHSPSAATLDNIGQDGFAPWRYTMQRPP
jgi:ABC-type glycerol-3-phosphate transport system substrate-binding protein